ncbi:MAG: 50S ribosomal protein L11 methyltransferase [Oscillospiraceae bacterium]|nr:50S ribosomal protein L11 methyltransferase [Oscillospiraceae bacterium]
MQWLELTVKTSSAGMEQTAALLTALGYDSFIMDDEAEFHEFLEGNRQYWGYVDESLSQQMRGLSQIRLYLEDGPGAREEVTGLQERLLQAKQSLPDADLGPLTVAIAPMQDEDWENNWKQYYQPIPIGKRLLIVPEWLHPENKERRIPILLDPGMIFGTGAHASTQMCLAALETMISGGEEVLDLGSGSGILSIAALRLGAAHAIGVDIDAKAEDIARENAALNDLGADRFTACTGDVLGDAAMRHKLGQACYDVVLANIVADVILPLTPSVPNFLRPGGVFVCSGVLDKRLPEVARAIEKAGMTITARYQKQDWCCLSAQRNEQ